MNYVDPTAWSLANNPDSIGVKVGGANYAVQNAKKAYSLTSPAAGLLRFEVRPGDVWAAVDPAAKERSEICGATNYPTGTSLNVAYGFMVEPGAANHAQWLGIGQFHQTTNDGNSPPFSIELRGEKMAVNISTPATGDRYIYTDTVNLTRGHEYAMQITALFDAKAGKLKVVRDGVTLVDYSGPLGWAGMNSVYWKNGIYRAASDTVLAVNYRGLAITAGAVAPPVVVVPPVVTPPTVDPVAQLQAQVTALQSANASLTTQVAQLQAKVAAARTALA